MLNAAQAGYKSLTPDAAERLRIFILSRIDVRGGFKALDESPDLYYTVFGLECMLAAGMDIFPAHIDELLSRHNTETASNILTVASLARLICRIGCVNHAEMARLAEQIEEFRRDDGGYADSRDSLSGSVYASFLITLAYSDMNAELPDGEKLINFVLGRQAQGGGLVNRCSEAEPCATSTAAGIVILNHFGMSTALHAGWLQSLEAGSGGFYLSVKSATADLISTAVAVHALSQVSAGHGRSLLHAEFVRLFWHPEGGFCGVPAGDHPDCEHTFYALMALGDLVNG